MGEPGGSSGFTDLLRELKGRSGLSYAELARRAFTTGSSLHRYCTGASLPRDWGVVAAVARECGATPEELHVLALLWSRALAGDGTDAGAGKGAGEGAGGTARAEASAGQGPPPSSPSVPPPSAARRTSAGARFGRVRVVGAFLAAVMLLLVTADARGPGASPGPDGPGARGDGGETWTWFPAPVGSEGFGVTVNSNTGAMPSFRVGSVRFWDSGTRWASPEPRRGVFDWAALDRLVDGAGRAGRAALLTLGGTPAWAAPGGPRTMYADGSRTVPPHDLADWDGFVRALVTRYRGRLGAYELWDTATDAHFYSGPPRVLAEMARRAAWIIRAVDPRATVVCPSMGGMRGPGGPAFVRAFARAGGFKGCDVAALKVHQEPAREPPEAMSADVAAAYRALHVAEVGAPIWITGPDYDVSVQPAVAGAVARDYAARFFLTALYERVLHVDRFYFYNWGGTRIPIVLQGEGGPVTAAAEGVHRLQLWLAGARIGGCGRGAAAGLPPNVRQCRFTRVPGLAPDAEAAIAWAESGTAVLASRGRGSVVRRLGGGAFRVPAGGWIPVTGQPELITAVPADARDAATPPRRP